MADEVEHPVLSAGYIEMVGAAYDALPHGVATEIGLDRKHVLRIKGAESISAELVDGVRRLLNRAVPEANLPPPLVKIESRDQYRWIELGRQLLAISPTRFRETCAQLEKIIAGAQAERDLDLSSDE